MRLTSNNLQTNNLETAWATNNYLIQINTKNYQRVITRTI